jgi:hypothetical protein
MHLFHDLKFFLDRLNQSRVMTSQPPRRSSGEGASTPLNSSTASSTSSLTSSSNVDLVLDEDTLVGMRELEREIAGANAAFANDAWRDSAQFPIKSVFVFNAVRKIRTVKSALPPVADLPPTVKTKRETEKRRKK